MAAIFGVLLSIPAGLLASRLGSGRVVLLGIGMTLAATAVMAFMAYYAPGHKELVAPLAYTLIPIAWSPLIVGGTAWAAQLAPHTEGKAMGAFNATYGAAAVIAAFTAGFVANAFNGFAAVILLATGFSVLSFVCVLALLWLRRKAPTKDGASGSASAPS